MQSGDRTEQHHAIGYREAMYLFVPARPKSEDSFSFDR